MCTCLRKNERRIMDIINQSVGNHAEMKMRIESENWILLPKSVLNVNQITHIFCICVAVWKYPPLFGLFPYQRAPSFKQQLSFLPLVSATCLYDDFRAWDSSTSTCGPNLIPKQYYDSPPPKLTASRSMSHTTAMETSDEALDISLPCSDSSHSSPLDASTET